MSAASNGCDCACPDPVITEIPGVEGEAGAAGANGTNGTNAYTVTTANFVVPAQGDPVSTAVGSSAWMTVGQNVYVQGAGYFSVTSKSSALQATLTYLADYPENTNAGITINSGAQVSPAGSLPALAAPLPTAITDNTTGTASNTLAAGVGVSIFTFQINANKIASGDLFTNYVPGFAFKILKVDALCNTAVTTTPCGATINLEIGSTNLTGGVVTLSGAYALGAQVNGTAVTANNTGTASDTISIEASGVTAFTEGSFLILVSIQNMDTANAVASLSDHINDLITSLS